MDVTPITCPKCGGTIQVPLGEKMCYCAFCSTQLFIEDGSRTVTYRIVDEARIREAEAMQSVESAKATTELEIGKISLIIAAGLILASIVLFLLGGAYAGIGATLLIFAIIPVCIPLANAVRKMNEARDDSEKKRRR